MIRRIVCAAVKDSNGSIFLGVRHYDKLMKAPKIGIQGFVDNRGEFHTREEAYVIAFDAGQKYRVKKINEIIKEIHAQINKI